MKHPITFNIIVIICSLMNIVTFVQAQGYEVLIMLHLGSDRQYCTIWMEDDHRNFITYIPPNVTDPSDWYYFNCHGYNEGQANVRNRIATLNTLDGSTTYWIHAKMDATASTGERIRGGFNENKCFDLHGGTAFKWHFDDHDYNDCKRIRDGN